MVTPYAGGKASAAVTARHGVAFRVHSPVCQCGPLPRGQQSMAETKDARPQRCPLPPPPPRARQGTFSERASLSLHCIFPSFPSDYLLELIYIYCSWTLPCYIPYSRDELAAQKWFITTQKCPLDTRMLGGGGQAA